MREAFVFSGEDEVWNVLGRFDCWNLWVCVRINPRRGGGFVGRPPEGVLVLVGSSCATGGFPR